MYLNESSQSQYRQNMIEKGFEVLEPQPNELLLDLDWEPKEGSPDRNIQELKKRLARLSQLVAVDSAYIKRSTEHYHGKVVMKKPICFLERQAFEMMLGSDPCRAIHNLKHYCEHNAYFELLSTLPGPWTKLDWSAEDGA